MIGKVNNAESPKWSTGFNFKMNEDILIIPEACCTYIPSKAGTKILCLHLKTCSLNVVTDVHSHTTRSQSRA